VELINIAVFEEKVSEQARLKYEVNQIDTQTGIKVIPVFVEIQN
jgi:hypothetical protein